MPYDFWIPITPEEWTVVTLTEDGDFILQDYSAEQFDRDETAKALGLEPSLVLRVSWAWEDDPIALLCGKHPLLPLRDTGLAAWSWARLAVDERYDEQRQLADPEGYAILENALKVAFSALTKTRLPYKKLVVARKDVENMLTQRTYFHMGQLFEKKTATAMKAVKLVLNGILSGAQEETLLEPGVRSTAAMTSFCNAGYAAMEAIKTPPEGLIEEEDLYDMLVEVAVRTMGGVQEAAGGLQRNPPWWG